MIEINLLPGSVKRQKKKMPALRSSAIRRPSMPAMNRASALLTSAWVIGLVAIAWLHFGSTRTLKQLDVDITAAQRDSVRLVRLRVLNDSLQRQITSVGARLQVLQEIDAGRYLWAHALDEISRALPQYTWLVSLEEVEPTTAGGPARIRILGRTGNTFALAKFMQDLELSPFLQRVTIISQAEVVENEKRMYSFTLETDYEEPGPDAIEMQPLFGEDAGLLSSDSAAMPPEGRQD